MLNSLDTRPRGSSTHAPTVVDVREGLRATLQPVDFDRVWCAACASIPVPTTVSSMSEPDLETLLDEIATQDRLCNVLAMSWRIRCTAARKMTELGR